MRYLSVCSGIEAATVAWHQLGWTPEAYSEIEKFPASVLAHHYPQTPNLGDMMNYKEWNIGDIDLLVGGTPCQSFSVAGLRKGLDDPRGNLALVYLGIAERFHPRWLLWENVPGVLSSNGGQDFGSFLGAMAQLGYGFAYRVLDTQYFGVPQRRRRVFVVGHLGDWRRAAAVLFESHSLQGHPAPSREKGKAVAALTANGIGTCGADDNQGQAGHLIPTDGCLTPWDSQQKRVYDSRAEISPTLSGSDGGGGRYPPAICLSTGQASAEIGIGIGTTLNCNHEAPIVTTMAFTQNQCGDVLTGDISPSMGTNQNATGRNTPKVMTFAPAEVGPAYILQAGHSHAVGCFSAGQSSEAGSIAYQLEQSPTLRSGGSGTNMTPTLHQGTQVRRLTPEECEKLQGFPPGYTNIPWRNKQESPDGLRYKALGNSMAVPVMRWIGERIQMVDEI